MLNKLTKIFKNISDVSLKTMFYGTKLALGVLLIGITAYLYNEYFMGSRYLNTIFCLSIIQSAFSLFVQFIIGGLIFDCVNLKKS